LQESSEQRPMPEPKDTASSGPGQDRNAAGIQRRFVDFLAWAITIVWIGSTILDAAVRTYDPSPTIHVAMLSVVGVAFTSGLIRKD